MGFIIYVDNDGHMQLFTQQPIMNSCQSGLTIMIAQAAYYESMNMVHLNRYCPIYIYVDL